MKLFVGLFLGLLLVSFTSVFFPVFAAKKFIPKTKTTYTKSVSRSSSSIPLSVKYRGDKLGIYFTFLNFNGIESADYSFTYTGNGIAQGAGGTVRTSNNPTSQRELLFGTCSSGVCTYHHNLTNAKLVFTLHYTNGTTATKSYRIKTYQ
jgi:hypothetical protein